MCIVLFAVYQTILYHLIHTILFFGSLSTILLPIYNLIHTILCFGSLSTILILINYLNIIIHTILFFGFIVNHFFYHHIILFIRFYSFGLSLTIASTSVPRGNRKSGRTLCMCTCVSLGVTAVLQKFTLTILLFYVGLRCHLLCGLTVPPPGLTNCQFLR